MIRPSSSLRCDNGPPSRVTSQLWQAGCPRENPASAGFDTVVLCAHTYQPPSSAFPGTHVIHAPMVDGPLDIETLAMAEATSDEVAEELINDRRVLVTCAMGLNRSGLVSGLSLVKAYGISGREAVATIRRARPEALFNSSFSAYLLSLPSRRP